MDKLAKNINNAVSAMKRTPSTWGLVGYIETDSNVIFIEKTGERFSIPKFTA